MMCEKQSCSFTDRKIVSLRSEPAMLDIFCSYFSKHWGKPELYCNCMQAALQTSSPLPQWFLAMQGDEIIGGCGLITNDFISRMDLYPWLCALYVEENFRRQGVGGMLIDYTAGTAQKLGFENLYCGTDHIGYYEKYRFQYIGTGYHPWNETSRIYSRKLT